MNVRLTCVAALTALAATPVVHAQDAGRWIWRAGMHTVQPKSHNHSVVNVDSAAMLTFSGAYKFTPHLGVEVLGGAPFKHDINLNGGGQVAETKHLPPTVSLQYYVNPNSAVRPYVGLGLNYTLFFSEETTGALAGSKLELDPSFGLAAQAGVDIAFATDWFINLDARWIDIDTDAKLDGAHIGSVEIDPYVFGVSIGRSF
ncbi:MAG: OmpW family outer membrane protein [Steroidobacteraceae bacterium]|jgi:outer membrane protein|nr:OmpW family outer membrane protein [Steroidobacteraceae bacterium]